MADIKLTRPAAGQTVVVPSAPDARMVLDFPADQVSIERPQGSDSLFFRFDDGSAIELQNFYTQYNKDDIPSFEVDGQLIAGADFFNAFGPDLAPAAGPAASPTRGGRYTDYTNSGLEDGVNHLDGLDYRLAFSGGGETDLNPYASAFVGNAAPTLSTGGAPITLGLTERAWDGTGNNNANDTQRGNFSVHDPDGDSLTATVNMGGKTVSVSTSAPTTIESDYGKLVITPTGGGSNITFEYTYTLKQDPYSPTDSLAQGETHTDGIVIQVNDGKGHTVTQPINVVITGSNDAPDITGVSGPLGLTEDGEYAAGNRQADGKLYGKSANDAVAGVFTDSGVITASDPDHGSDLTFGLATAAGSLKAGDVIGSLVYIDPVTAVRTETPVTITGVTAASADGGTPLVITTNYGTLTLNVKTGHYDFALKHDANGATDALTEGDTVSLSLVPTVRDQYGASDGNAAVTRQDADGHSTTVNSLGIVIHGTNDAPVIDVQHTGWTAGQVAGGVGSVQEDNALAGSVTGKVAATDVDAGETSSLRYGFVHNEGGQDYSRAVLYVKADANGNPVITSDAPTDGNQGNHDGYYGTLTMTSGGEYTFALYNKADAVNQLGQGVTKTFGVNVVAEDVHGAYDTTAVRFQIVGTNDAPVVSGADPLSVTEQGFKDQSDSTLGANQAFAGTVTATGAVHATDMDQGDTLSYSVTKASGSGTDSGKMTQTTGTFTVGGDATTYDTAYKIATGTLYFSTTSGKYVFELNNNAVDHLAQSQSQDVTFTVDVRDSQAHTPSTIALTIHGTNDKPTLDLSAAAYSTEETATSITGSAVAADVDDGHQLTFGLASGQTDAVMNSVDGMKAAFDSTTGNGVTEIKGTYGTLSITDKGLYTYTVDQTTGGAADSLPKGATGTDSFTVYVRDEFGAWSAKPLSVTVKGVNDAPVITAAPDLNVTETGVSGANTPVPGVALASDQIVAHDVDAGTVLHYSVVGMDSQDITQNAHYNAQDKLINIGGSTYDAAYKVAEGTLYLNTANGNYVFELDNNAVNHLNVGDTQTLKFNIGVSDTLATTTTLGSTTQTAAITVNIHGTNDLPKLELAGTNPDPSDPGSMYAAANGSVTFKASEDVAVSGTFTVQDPDSDGTGGAVNSSFDGGHKISLQLDAGNSSASGADKPGSVDATHADPGLGHNASITTTYGVLTVNTDGTYAFTPNANANALDQGDSVTMQFKVTLTDMHGAYDTKNISITLDGKDDAPVITTKGSATLNLVESEQRDGNTAANDFNHASAGVGTASSSFTVKDVDAHDTQSVVLTINGADVSWNDSHISVNSATGVITYTTDYGTLTITPSGAGSVSTAKGLALTPSSAGAGITYTYTYTLDNAALNAKNANFTQDYNFEIKVADSANKVVSQAFDVNVKGANDIPLISDSGITVTEDGVKVGNTSFAGTLSASAMLLPAAGDANYDPDNSTVTFGVVGLQSGSSAWDVATQGTKLPSVSTNTTTTSTGAKTSHAVTERILGSYTAAGADGAVHSYVVTNYGILDVNTKTGDYTFTLGTDAAALKPALTIMLQQAHPKWAVDKVTSEATSTANSICAKVNALPQGEQMDLKFAATVTDNALLDSHGNAIAGTGGHTGAATITVTIVGTNDKPTLTLTSSAISMTEDVSSSVTGTVTVSDPDMGETKTFGILQSGTPVADLLKGSSAPDAKTTITNDYGTLSIDNQGNYTFTQNNGSAAVQNLGEGQTHSETYYVVFTDKNGAFDIKPVTVTITGKNDPTVINAKWTTPDHAAIEAGVLPAAKDRTDETQYTKNTQLSVSATGFIGATDVDATDQAELQKSGSAAAMHYTITTSVTDPTQPVDINKCLAGENGSSGAGWKLADVKGVQHLYVTTEHGTLDITAFNLSALTKAQQAMFSSGALPAFTYTFTANDASSAVQELQFNHPLADSFVVAVTGSNMTQAPSSTVQLTINGTNDRPEVVITDSQTHINDTASTLSGELVAGDVDDKSGFTYSLVSDGTHSDANLSSDNIVMKGDHGWIELNSETGAYTYHVTDPDVVKLNSGEKDYDTFYVRVMDAHGAYSEIKALTITIDGANQAGSLEATSAAASGAEAGVAGAVGYSANANLYFTSQNGRFLGANEAVAHKDITGTLKVSDTDNTDYGNFRLNTDANTGKVEVSITVNDSSSTEYCTVSNGIIHTSYGDMTLSSNGSYTFAINETKMNPLTHNDKVSLSVSVNADSTQTVNHQSTADTGSHETVTGNVTITINGTNDAPVVLLDKLPTTTSVTDADVSGLDWKSTILGDFIQKEAQEQIAYKAMHGSYDASSWLIKAVNNAGQYAGWCIPDVYSKNDIAYWIGMKTWYNEDVASKMLAAIAADDTASAALKASMATFNTPSSIDLSHVDWTSSVFGQFIKAEVATQLAYNAANNHGGNNVFDVNSWLVKALKDEGRLYLITDAYKNDDIAVWLRDVTKYGSEIATKMLQYIAADSVAAQNLKGEIASHPIGTGGSTAHLSDTINAFGVANGDLASYATDVDNGAKLTFFGVNDDNKNDNITTGNAEQYIKGVYGTLIINPDGHYTYVLDRNSDAYTHLKGDGTETFSVYVRDEYNAVAKDAIPITITVPKSSGSGSGSGSGHDAADMVIRNNIDDHGVPYGQNTSGVKEDTSAKVTASGTIKNTDVANNPDSDNDLFLTGKYSQTDPRTAAQDDLGTAKNTSVIRTSYGTIYLLPDGSYTYTINNDHPDVQGLGAGETITQVFHVVGSKVGKGVRTADITITIEGTNDAPYLSGSETTVSTLQEDESKTWSHNGVAAGSFTATDRDLTDRDALKLVDNGKGTLKAGTDANTYTVDGKYGTYTITRETGADGQTRFSYSYELKDKYKNTNFVGEYDDKVNFYISDNGSADKDHVVEQSLSVHLAAKNTAPAITSVTTPNGKGGVTEDIGIKEDTTSIPITVTAADGDTVLGAASNQTLTYGIVNDGGIGMLKGVYGTLIHKTDGTYEYQLNNANPDIQALKEGAIKKDTFTITVTDGVDTVEKTISITITGTNDAPSITLHQAGGAAGSGASLYVTETEGHLTSGSLPSVSGNAVAHDVDSDVPPATFSIDKTDVYAIKDHGEWVQCGNIKGATQIGTFSIDASTGAYTFTMAQTAEVLAHGDKVVLSTTVTATDSAHAQASAPVQVTVSGANTAPVIESFDHTTLVDTGLGADGVYTAPVLSGTVTASDMDGNSEISGYYIKTASGSLVKELSNNYGTLKIADNGGYSFTLTSKGQSLLRGLGSGETLSQSGLSQALRDSFTFSIVAKDQYNALGSKSLSIDFNGVNDAPVFTMTNSKGNLANVATQTVNGVSTLVYTASVTEDGANGGSAFTAAAAATDVDANDSRTYALSFNGAQGSSVTTGHGAISIDATGGYTYTLNNKDAAVQALGEGQTLTETVAVTVTDKLGATSTKDIVVTIHGTNDAPVFTMTDAHGDALSNVATQTVNGVSTLVYTASVTEDGAHGATVYTGSAAATDVDANDSRTYALSFNGAQGSAVTTAHGAISIDAAGNYTYTLNDSDAAVQALGEGQTLTETVAVTVTDQLGATSTKDIVVTIHGTNDAPEASDVSHAGWNGQITAHDVDSNDTLHYSSPADASMHFGSLTVQDDGSYAYHLNTTEDALGSLSEHFATATDGTLHDTFSYTVNDRADATGLTDTGHLTFDIANNSALDNQTHLLFAAEHNGGYEAVGGAGDYVLVGGSHADTLTGGTGNNILYGGEGDDNLYGGTGHNYLYGGSGNDTLFAGNAGDHLYGGAGSDHLTGGTGNDFLDGGPNLYDPQTGLGGNVLDGGAGNDVLVFHQGDSINGGAGTDVLLVSSAEHPAGTVDDLFAGTTGVEVVVAGAGVDSLTDMQKLADKGITFDADNKVELDASKGWAVDAGSSTSEHSVWTNASEHLTVTTAANEDAAADAAKTILLTHNG